MYNLKTVTFEFDGGFSVKYTPKPQGYDEYTVKVHQDGRLIGKFEASGFKAVSTENALDMISQSLTD